MNPNVWKYIAIVALGALGGGCTTDVQVIRFDYKVWP